MPPMCCEVMNDEVWAERGRRLDAAMRVARESHPTACPACGSDAGIYPNFPDDTWACADCLAVWEVGR